jgi:hypothetical protein
MNVEQRTYLKPRFPGGRTILDSLTQSFVGPEKGSAFLPHAHVASDGNTVRGIIKVSMVRHNAWLAEVSARGRGRDGDFP